MSAPWTPFKDPHRTARNEVVGQIVELMLGDPQYSRAQLRNLSVWVIPPVSLKQAKIFYGPAGHPLGYVLWAGFSEDTARRARVATDFIPHLTEWNEGDELWITDFLARPGAFPIMRAFVRDHLGAEYGALHWTRARAAHGPFRYFSATLRK